MIPISIERRTDNKDIALVFIHGIVELPHFFNFLIEKLPLDISYFAPTLTGHGLNSKHFGTACSKKWKKQIDDLTDDILKEYKKIIFVGHSLGSLLSIYEANRIKEKASSIFLLNCPLKVRVTWLHIKTYLKVGLFRKEKTDDEAVNRAMEYLGVSIPRNPLEYLYWARPFISLLKEIGKARKDILTCSTRGFAFHSKQDELVSMKSLKYINKNQNIEINIMKDSSHNYYPQIEKDKIIEKLNKCIRSSLEFMI